MQPIDIIMGGERHLFWVPDPSPGPPARTPRERARRGRLIPRHPDVEVRPEELLVVNLDEAGLAELLIDTPT